MWHRKEKNTEQMYVLLEMIQGIRDVYENGEKPKPEEIDHENKISALR